MVTNAGLKDLLALRRLRELCLCGTAITDVGLKDLPPLKQLWDLSLDQTAVTVIVLDLQELRTALLSCRIHIPHTDGIAVRGRSRAAAKPRPIASEETS